MPSSLINDYRASILRHLLGCHGSGGGSRCGDAAGDGATGGGVPLASGMALAAPPLLASGLLLSFRAWLLSSQPGGADAARLLPRGISLRREGVGVGGGGVLGGPYLGCGLR